MENIGYVLREFRRFAFELDDVLHLLNEKHRNYNYKSRSSVWGVRGALGLNYIGYNKSLEWSSPSQPASPSTGSSHSRPSSVPLAPLRLLPLHDLDRRRRLILYRPPLLLPKINQNLLAGATHRRQYLILLRTRRISSLLRSRDLLDAPRKGKRGTPFHSINKKCINSIFPYFHHLRSVLLLLVTQ